MLNVFRRTVRAILFGAPQGCEQAQKVTPEFTALVTGHGKTKSYPHRLKLMDDPACPCGEERQTSEHIIFECNIFEAQRSSLINQIMVSGATWPPAIDELITKYLNAFSKFVKSVDFQKLN